MGQPYLQSSQVIGNIPLPSNVILIDDFETLLKWTPSGTGADYTVELDDAIAYYDNQSLYLKTKTTDPAANDYAQALRSIPIPLTKFINVEFLFMIAISSNCKYLGFHLVFEYALISCQAGIIFNAKDGRWYYYNSAGSVALLSGANVPLTQNYWHRTKFAIDLTSLTYNSLIVDNNKFDIEGTGFYSTPTTSKSQGYAKIQLYAEGSTPPEAWIDNLIIRSSNS